MLRVVPFCRAQRNEIECKLLRSLVDPVCGCGCCVSMPFRFVSLRAAAAAVAVADKRLVVAFDLQLVLSPLNLTTIYILHVARI